MQYSMYAVTKFKNKKCNKDDCVQQNKDDNRCLLNHIKWVYFKCNDEPITIILTEINT